jgi:hypothetical protein
MVPSYYHNCHNRYEDELDVLLVGGPPKLPAPLIAQLESKMAAWHGSAAIVLRPEFELGDQAHLNRSYLHLAVEAISKLLVL